jgi:hypothetical protein
VGLSRTEMWARLGRLRLIEPMASAAYQRRLESEWRLGSLDHHGQSWRESFRGSQFPGDSPRPCARKLVYWLAGVPEEKPTSRDVHGTAFVGQAIEDDLVKTLDFDDRVLSVKPHLPTGIEHLGFEDADSWLTTTPDIVVLPPFKRRPHLVEVKSKDTDVVNEMQNGRRKFDPAHRLQLLVSIAMLNELMKAGDMWPSVWVCKHTWRLARPQANFSDLEHPERYLCVDHHVASDEDGCLQEIELEPPTTGSVYYHSRERPRVTQEWIFELPDGFIETGRAVLAEARAHFEAGTIPPHPFDGKQWSELPCKWCDFKKHACKPDQKDKITQLSQSHGISFAREVTEDAYDYEHHHKTVIDRWLDKEGVYVRRSSEPIPA